MEPRPHRRTPRRQSGSALIFVLAIVLAIAFAGIAVVRLAGGDRMSAARSSQKDRGLVCAEAGLQYGRRFFGSTYETSNGWNTYLSNPTLGYRYVPVPTSVSLSAHLSARPLQVKGASNGTTLDTGADLDGDGSPDFWVSIRDDDDERPLGIADNPARDNNETVILRSQCTNPAFARVVGGQPEYAVIEVVLAHVQGSSGYGGSQAASNAMDLVGGR